MKQLRKLAKPYPLLDRVDLFGPQGPLYFICLTCWMLTELVGRGWAVVSVVRRPFSTVIHNAEGSKIGPPKYVGGWQL